MDECIRTGVSTTETVLPGRLGLRRRAPMLYRRLMRGLVFMPRYYTVNQYEYTDFIQEELRRVLLFLAPGWRETLFVAPSNRLLMSMINAPIKARSPCSLRLASAKKNGRPPEEMQT